MGKYFNSISRFMSHNQLEVRQQTDKVVKYVSCSKMCNYLFQVSVSNAKNVTLLSVSREISGDFQCEVSADAPSFHTQVLSTPMTVAGE